MPQVYPVYFDSSVAIDPQLIISFFGIQSDGQTLFKTTNDINEAEIVVANQWVQSLVPVVSVLWCQECIAHGIFANTDPFEIARPLSSTKLTPSRTTGPAEGSPKPLTYSQTPGVFGSNTDESEQSQSRSGKLKSSADLLKQRANNHDTPVGPLEPLKSTSDAAGSRTPETASSTPSNKNFEVISLDSDEEAPTRPSNKGSKHAAQTASGSAVPSSPRSSKTQARPQESHTVANPKPSPAQSTQQDKPIVKKAALLPPSPARTQPNQPLPKPTHSNMPPPTGAHNTSSARSTGTPTANLASSASQSPRKHIGNASPRTVQPTTVATQPRRVNPALVDDDSEEDDDHMNASTSSSELTPTSAKRPNTTLMKRPIAANAYFVKKSASAYAPHATSTREIPARSLPPSRTPSQTGDLSSSSASNNPIEGAEGDTTDEEVRQLLEEAPASLNVARIPSTPRSKKKSPLIDSSSEDSSYLPGENSSGYESEDQTSSEDSESRHGKIPREHSPLNRKKRQQSSMESYHSDSGSDQRRRSNTKKRKESSSRDSSRPVQPSKSTKSTRSTPRRTHDTTESSGSDEDGNHERMDLDDPAPFELTGSRMGSNGSTRTSHGSQKQGRISHSSDSWRNSRTEASDRVRYEPTLGSSSSRQTSLKRKLEPSHSTSTSKPRRSKRVERSSDEDDWTLSSDSLEEAAPRSAKRPKLSETREERHLAIYLGGLKGAELKQEKDALAMVRFPSSLRVKIVDNLAEATHVIAHDTGMRTYTMMRAISKGKWVLRFMWFVKLLRHAQPPDEEQFEFPTWPGARQSRLHVQNRKGRSGLPLRDLHFDLRKLNAEERELAADLIAATGGYEDEESVHVYSIIVVPDDQFNPEAVGKRQRVPFSALIESISKWENCLTPNEISIMIRTASCTVVCKFDALDQQTRTPFTPNGWICPLQTL